MQRNLNGIKEIFGQLEPRVESLSILSLAPAAVYIAFNSRVNLRSRGPRAASKRQTEEDR